MDHFLILAGNDRTLQPSNRGLIGLIMRNHMLGTSVIFVILNTEWFSNSQFFFFFFMERNSRIKRIRRTAIVSESCLKAQIGF